MQCFPTLLQASVFKLISVNAKKVKGCVNEVSNNKFQMASDEESLRALEGLMSEFFAVATSNDRKREIEQLLNNFSQQRDAWKHCLFFMAHTSNEYVMMYCMTVLENLIHRQWVGMQGADKSEIRGTLNNFLMSHHSKVPSFVRNKLVKLLVDIGRLDWPHFYPDFFSSVLQRIQNPDTVVLGLILLQTTSEELASPREDLSVARKEELHRLLLAQVPNMLSLINNVLASILEKHRSFVSATPPPSPTQSGGSVPKTPSMSVITSSPAKPSILSNMFKSPQSRVQTESLPPLDSHAQQVSVLALNCLSHLFSWIPLSSTITPALLSTIFHFAAFGCEASPGGHSSSPGSSLSSQSPETGNQQLGIMAMTCINELLAKNCVPQEFEHFLLQMFQQTFYLLQRITKDSTTSSTGNRLAQLDETYVDKFTEFLRLFVSIHLRRFESNQQFPILEFLSLLFNYTFKQPTNEGYFNCLDIWNVFLDYLVTNSSLRTGGEGSIIAKYHDALESLINSVLQKFQFKYNQSQLDELDDDALDDDSETEWQHFLRQNLETVAKVSELLPAETFRLLFHTFQENHTVYMGLEKHISEESFGRKLNVSAENDSRRLHCTLRDLSSLLQALGRLSLHFIGEKFTSNFNEAHALVEKLIHTACYGSRLKLFELKSLAPVLQTGFVEVQAQALAAVKANVSWLAQFYVESSGNPAQWTQCNTLITTVVDTVVPMFHKQIPEKMSHSAAHLTLSLFTTIRAMSLWQLPHVQTFYDSVSQGSIEGLSFEVQLLLYRSLSHYLLLPWPNMSDQNQQWDVRGSHHKAFLAKLTHSYTELRHTARLAEDKQLQEQAKPCVKRVLHVITDLVETIAVEGVSTSKKLCYQSIQSVIQTTLNLFPIYIHQSDITDDILGFFLALFHGLRVQMGVPFTEQVIQTFMSLFTREQLAETILQESTSGYKVVEKFLKILQVIVMEPGAAFKAFLPNIISICMDQIYPIIAERLSPDIKPSLYCLLHQFLSHNWRYFFKGNVLKMVNEDSQPEQMENQQQFVSIMQCFGQSFMQPDIAVFRQNLEALEDLNENRKLYSKAIFKEMMLGQFLSVLLQVLLAKSHDLLSEEIGIVLYNMGSVDFDTFYNSYLPNFLSECDGIDDNQKATLAHNFNIDRDLPSFTQSIHRFTNDLRYYRLVSSSLPAGSVKL